MKVRSLFRTLTLLLCGWAGASGAVDAPPLILQHLSTAEGLPQSTVYATLQDSQGFIWIGTEDGLVRYDGHELHRYTYAREAPHGLPGNFIYQIVEDSHQDLWLAVKDAGLARWNRATDTFTVYRHAAADPGSLASDTIRTVLADARGRIWVGTGDSGLDVLAAGAPHFEHLRHRASDPDSLIDDHIITLAQDRSGALWIGTAGGLDRWQPERAAFTHFLHDATDPQSLSGNQVSRIVEDHDDTLWIGTLDGGLDHMNRSGVVLRTFRHENTVDASLGSDDVHALLEDQAGHLWIGTTNGLDLLDRATGRFTHYRHDDSNSESLRDSYVLSLYEDGTGLIWIGTRSGGVSRWDPRSWELGGWRPAWLGQREVTAFADAPAGKVWIASLGGGLVQFDATTGTARDLDSLLGRRHSLPDERVMSLRGDRHGTLWIGTMTEGLHKLTATGELEAIPTRVDDPHALSAAGIMTIYEARNGLLWVGTHGGGANVLDPATGLVHQLPHDWATVGATSAANISAIAEDRYGNIWIGTEGGGLDLARPDGSVVKVFRHEPADLSTLPSNTVYALTTDAEGRLWVATDRGLAQAVGSARTPAGVHFETVSHTDGLSSDTIYSVLPDAAGHLWLSSDAGLMRFDPDTRTVKTYHREQGLQGEDFDSFAFFRLSDGRLCFGGPGGFNIFEPARLSESRGDPRLALTGLAVLGVPVASPQPYWLLHRIAVDYRASVVSLDFGVLDFTSPKRNRLAYRMAGLTDRWIELGDQRSVTLTNLDAGDHVLEVRAANADSVWSGTPLRLTIHREPAPWKSRPAFLAYTLAALLLVIYGVRLQRLKYRRVVKAQQRLESEVALRTRELMESNRKLADAAQAKSNFLDRMSHELRTPMNGVVGMTELLARTSQSAAQSRLTQTIRSSAQVLLQIVNDLLDLSKIQAGKVELEELPIDLAGLLAECGNLFAIAAESKGLGLVIRPPQQSLPLRGDPLRIRQVLMNLIGNAIKFTAAGQVTVSAEIESAATDSATIHFSVSDTGIGMDAATLAKIFEPFTQADESTTRRYGGSGLGLTICRELAGLLGGSIRVESQPAAGTTFHFFLPLKLGIAPAAAAPNTSLPAPFLAGHVLIVEDDAVNAAVAQGYLAELGCSCVWVESGPEALARSASERFDLIFMDLSMPSMDGFATTALIRQREQRESRPRIPIMALTAHDAAKYRERCAEGGMDDVLTKPYTFDQCTALLRQWLTPAVPASAAAMAPAPAAAAPTEGLTQIDAEAVARLRNLRSGARNDLYPKLVDLFHTSSAKALSALQQALEAGDLPAAGAVCHKLAASAANVGALAFAADVRELERHCAAGEQADAEAQRQRLQAAHPALMEELMNFRLRNSA